VATVLHQQFGLKKRQHPHRPSRADWRSPNPSLSVTSQQVDDWEKQFGEQRLDRIEMSNPLLEFVAHYLGGSSSPYFSRHLGKGQFPPWADFGSFLELHLPSALPGFPVESLRGELCSYEAFSNRWLNNSVYLVSVAFGGVGVTLTAARIGIFLGTEYTPIMFLQGRGRLSRVTQVSAVQIYRIISRMGELKSKVVQEMGISVDEYRLHFERDKLNLISSVFEKKENGAIWATLLKEHSGELGLNSEEKEDYERKRGIRTNQLDEYGLQNKEEVEDSDDVLKEEMTPTVKKNKRGTTKSKKRQMKRKVTKRSSGTKGKTSHNSSNKTIRSKQQNGSTVRVIQKKKAKKIKEEGIGMKKVAKKKKNAQTQLADEKDRMSPPKENNQIVHERENKAAVEINAVRAPIPKEEETKLDLDGETEAESESDDDDWKPEGNGVQGQPSQDRNGIAPTGRFTRSQKDVIQRTSPALLEKQKRKKRSPWSSSSRDPTRKRLKKVGDSKDPIFQASGLEESSERPPLNMEQFLKELIPVRD
jgi:hypothetical protein